MRIEADTTESTYEKHYCFSLQLVVMDKQTTLNNTLLIVMTECLLLGQSTINAPRRGMARSIGTMPRGRPFLPRCRPKRRSSRQFPSTMILMATKDNPLGTMIDSMNTTQSHESIETEKSSPISKLEAQQPANDDVVTESAVVPDKPTVVHKKEQHDTVQKVKVMHEILVRRLKKSEEQKTFLFQERANKRRSFNHLRRTLSSNNKSELGDESTLEQMRQQLEALREEKEHVEDEIEKTQQRLSELIIIKESPEEKAARLDELCTMVTKEFASRRKPTYEA